MDKKIENPTVSSLLDLDEIPDEIIDPREALLADIGEMKAEVVCVKTEIQEVQTTGNPITEVAIFNEMSDLNGRAVAILDACKDDIERSSLLDAEMISAYASLIKSTREIISDHLIIYRDRQKHIEKIELEELKQEYRKELLVMKNNLDKSCNDDYGDHKVFVQEALIDILDDNARAERESLRLELDPDEKNV